MTKRDGCYKMSIAEALAAAETILRSGHDVEMRAVNKGKFVIVYELNKTKVHKGRQG